MHLPLLLASGHGSGDLHGLLFWISFLTIVVVVLIAATATCLVAAARSYDRPARRVAARPARHGG